MTMKSDVLSIRYNPNENVYELYFAGNKIVFSIVECLGKKDSFDDEIKLLKIDPDTPISVIPVNAIDTRLQFIQAILGYIRYKDKLRIRNRGLLIASLVLGTRQVRETIELLRKTYTYSDKKYYMICVGCIDICRRASCIPVSIRFDNIANQRLVKNIRVLIERL